MIALFIEVVDSYCAAFCSASIVIFLVTGCSLLKCIIEDIANDLKLLQISEKNVSNKKHKKVLNEYFCYIIQDFSDAKQFSKNSNILIQNK